VTGVASGNLGWALGGIYATLATASGITSLLGWIRPGFDLGEVRTRIRSWWAMTAAFTLALVIHPLLSVAFFAMISMLGFREFLRFRPVPLSRHVVAVSIVGIIGQYLLVAEGDYGAFVLFVGLFVFLAVPAAGALAGATKGFVAATGTVLFGLFTTTFALGHAPMLLRLPAAEATPAGGAGLLVYLVVLTEVNDVAQFLWGKALGTRKAAPLVSPGKTVEGLLGGLSTSAVLGGVLAPVLTPFSPTVGAAVGLLIGIGGFLGDITISAAKRDAGVKDSGTLLPGHGGILDRIDSLIVTAPLFFHCFRYFHG
jgi:phosphatidate cytidylyltransferase